MEPQQPARSEKNIILTPARLLISLTNIVLGFVEILLSIRILLKLLAANPRAPFVAWIYDSSASLLAPFEGMFPSPTLANGFVIDFSALFALVVFAFIGYFIREIIEYIFIQIIGQSTMTPKKPDPPRPPLNI